VIKNRGHIFSFACCYFFSFSVQALTGVEGAVRVFFFAATASFFSFSVQALTGVEGAVRVFFFAATASATASSLIN